jgi:hypothetical protein
MEIFVNVVLVSKIRLQKKSVNQWHFVSNLSRKSFEIRGLSPRICKDFEDIEIIIIRIGKNNWDLEICKKSLQLEISARIIRKFHKSTSS